MSSKFQNELAARLYDHNDFTDEASDETWACWWGIGFDWGAGWYIISEDEQGFVDVTAYGHGDEAHDKAWARWERILSVIDQCAPVYHD